MNSTTIKGIVKKGEYFDSVSLMIAAHKINQMEGVIDSAVVMGTEENKAILKAAGFLLAEFQEAEDTDLLIAVKTGSEGFADDVLANIGQELKNIRKKEDASGKFAPRCLEKAVEFMPGANLSLISVPGKYAADEAMKALKKGLHVMIFSDHVPFEKEVELKKYAREKNLIVMGPDCGTAIINGVPLAFANVVKRGNIGVVAASGTGLQEVTTLISNGGGGISQAIGTGGRDIKKEVGGIMFIAAVKALAEDENTDVILLVAKPPHPEVLKKIGEVTIKIRKRVVGVFLGADRRQVRECGLTPAYDLEDGAISSLDFAGVAHSYHQQPGIDIEETANKIVEKLNKRQKYPRALFTGGTFCSETRDIFNSDKHTIIDFGDDEFTLGKPHPMIDFSTRNKRIIEEAENKETAMILLDLVLGYGANMNPIPDIVPVIKRARQSARDDGREIPIVCSVTGTDEDPQNRSHVVKALKDAGVIVCRSNAQASKLCKEIIDKLTTKDTKNTKR